MVFVSMYQKQKPWFLVTSCVHQGDPERSCLFNLYDFVMCVFTNYCTKDDFLNINMESIQDEYPDTIIKLCNVLLQDSTEFKYVGSYVSYHKSNMADIEVNHCMQVAYRWSTFKTLRFTLDLESGFCIVLSAAGSHMPELEFRKI